MKLEKKAINIFILTWMINVIYDFEQGRSSFDLFWKDYIFEGGLEECKQEGYHQEPHLAIH